MLTDPVLYHRSGAMLSTSVLYHRSGAMPSTSVSLFLLHNTTFIKHPVGVMPYVGFFSSHMQMSGCQAICCLNLNKHKRITYLSQAQQEWPGPKHFVQSK